MSAAMIQQFDIFAQLVASGTIAASARSLALAPAEIVAAMNALEDRLGCRIFAVADGAVELTDTGRKLVSALGEMGLDDQEQWVGGLLSAPGGETPHPPKDRRTATTSIGIDAIVAPAAPPTTEMPDKGKSQTAPRTPQTAPVPEPVRTIVLASHPAIFGHFQEALVAFEEASPDIGITMRLAAIGVPEVLDLFARKLADIAYFYTLEEPAGFPSRYAWSERISLFVGEGHPLAKKDSMTARDLAATPYAALAPGNLARTLAEEALARGGLEVGPAITQTDNLYEIMKQVQSSPCYFAAFGPMARDFGKMPGITRLAWAQGLPQVQVRQAVRDDLADDAAILALAEFLFR